jgi:hypothetical protein
MGEPIANRALTEPHEGRLPPSDPDYQEILRAHAAALYSGAISYVDPRTGMAVLTAGYLFARGSCCQSGCRHCPYVG